MVIPIFVKDLNKLILDQPFVEKPGIKFHYSSGNTQILSIIIERATGEKIIGPRWYAGYAPEFIGNPVRKGFLARLASALR